MVTNGVFIRQIKRNNKTGETVFIFRTENNEIFICHGIIFDFFEGTPLTLYFSGNKNLIYINGEDRLTDEISWFSFYEENKDILSYFLDHHYKFGSQISEKILLKTNSHPFSAEYNPEEVTKQIVSEIKTKQEDKIKSALISMKHIYEKWKLLKEFIKLGSSYSSCMDYIEDHESFLKTARDNPYSLLSYHIPFNACEQLGIIEKIEMSDKRRISELVHYIMTGSAQQGNTKMTFEDLCHSIRYLEEKAGSPYRTDALFIAGFLLDSKAYEIVENEKKDAAYIGYKDLYEKERTIVENVQRLERSAIRYSSSKKTVEDIEKELGVSYSNDQKSAFDILLDGGVKILTGGPGTGKTTVLNGLIRKFKEENPGREVALCAPTGKAAARMKETTGIPSSTIHTLLKIRPYEGAVITPEKLTADMLVIDECSMLDTELAAYIFSAAKSGSLVLLIGDEDQLEPVMAGNVFHDLLNSRSSIPIYHLKEIHRQKNDSEIVANAKKITNGILDIRPSENFHILRVPDKKALSEKTCEIAKTLYKEVPDKVRVFSPTKKIRYETGSIRMNAKIQKTLHQSGERYVCFGVYQFYKNDRIIFTRNNYEEGYINGQDGVITDVQEFSDSRGNEVNITISSEGNVYHIKGKNLNDIALSYVITAHKSQGSETDTAVIIVPQDPENMLLRKLLYVEVTRAKREVYIISEKDAFEKAISNKVKRKERETWIQDMIDDH